jgi:hypothetical protein
MKEPQFDEYGKIDLDTMCEIKAWPDDDPLGFIEYLKKAWHQDDGGYFTETGNKIIFFCGENEDNSDTIELVRSKKIMWQILWESSNRFGYHVFDKGRVC